MGEEADIRRRCFELGSLLTTTTGRPFKLLLIMGQFRFELDTSMILPLHPMAEKPRKTVRKSPSRSRRDAKRRNLFFTREGRNFQSPPSLSPLPAPTSAVGWGQAAAADVPAAADEPAAENLLVHVQQPNMVAKRRPGRPAKKSKGLEVIRGSDSDQLHPSPDPDSEEEMRNERLVVEEEEEVVMEDEEERRVVVGADLDLETLCLQLSIITKNNELAVAAAQMEHEDPWDPDDPICRAYLGKIEHQYIVNEGRHRITKKYREYWDRIQEEEEEEEEGGGVEEGGGEQGGG